MLKYTQLKNANRQNLRDVLPLGKPFTLLVEPSSLCNFKCIHNIIKYQHTFTCRYYGSVQHILHKVSEFKLFIPLWY